MLRFLLSLGDVMSAAPLPSIDTLSMTAPSEISTWTGPATFSKLVATILDDLVRRNLGRARSAARTHVPCTHACGETWFAYVDRGLVPAMQLVQTTAIGTHVTTIMVENLNPLAVVALLSKVK